jgi:hypothetical protein
MAGRIQILTLVLVFLAALFIHYLLTTKEGFTTSTRTRLTKENVKPLLDAYTLALLGQYQKFKALNSTDPRVKFRLQNLAKDINTLNDQYPAIIYNIEQFDYSKIPALSLEDLTIVKDFAIRTVGINYTSDITAPANQADIDTMANRFQSILGIALQKAPLAGIPIPSDIQTSFATIKTNLNKLKTQLPNMKSEDVPLFKGDFYDFALPFSFVNFVPPADITSGGIDIRTENLPKPQTATEIVSTAIGLTPTPPAPVPTAAPVASVSPVATAPLTPMTVSRENGMKFSELIKSLMTYTQQVEQKADTGTVVSSQTSAEKKEEAKVEPSPVDMTKAKAPAASDLKKMVSEEVDSRLKDFLLTPKDKQNKDVIERTIKPVDRRMTLFNSDALQQGSWFRGAETAAGCPYAAGQQGQAPVPYPIDMNDYIRKDSIPCYGCTLN